MCLYKSHSFPKVSRKPIQCYKVFIDLGDGCLTTPYEHHFCNIGDIIKAKNHWLIGIFKRELEGEVVHAFVNNAIVEDKCFMGRCICLCEIPSFTPYWLGEYNEIAASKIKIIKKLDLK